MAQYVLRRLLMAIPVVIAMSILVFAGTRVVPGDICAIVLGAPDVVGEAQCARVRSDLGLDQPFVTQYFNWAGNMLQGDFGRSMTHRRPVVELMADRIPTTLQLAVMSSGIAILMAIPIGVFSALKQDKWPDILGRVVTIGWLSMPSFWVGTMLVTLPAIWWGYSTPVPYTQLWDNPLRNLEQMWLPAISLALGLSATLARLTRSTMLEVLRQDYVRTARAKGLHQRVVLSRHALKNAMLPVVTLMGIQLSFLLSGTVILESLFGLPGLGTLLIESVITKDFLTVQALVLFFALTVVMINLAVDISYGLFDPRVRYS